MRLNQRSLRATMLAALLATSAACGGQLSEEEVLARSATNVSDTRSNGVDGAPGAATTTTVLGDAGPDGSSAAPVAEGDAGIAAPSGEGDTGPAQGGAPAPDAPTADAPCTTSGSGPLVVGNVGNYSGAGGSAVGQMPRGVQLWAAAINSQGGLCGREVKVVVQDDGGDPARYGSLSRDLVENSNVVSFVGNGAPLSAQGGLDYHRQSGVPVVGNDCTSMFWFTSPVLFPQCVDPRLALADIVGNGVELSGKTKFGYVYCTEAQGCLDADKFIQDGAAAEGGAEIVFRRSVSVTQVDFTAECQSARSAGADLFFVGADPATLQRVAQSCARQNYFPQYVSATVTWSHDALSSKGLENVALVMLTPPFTGASGGPVDEYNQAVASFAPGIQPGPSLALGWAAGKLFEAAATASARTTGRITPDGLIAALYAIENERLGGFVAPLNFDADGAHNGNCYFSMQGDGTGDGYTFPHGATPICP